MDDLNRKMKKWFSCHGNSQLQSCQQQEPRLGMFYVGSFPREEVRRAWDRVRTSKGAAEEIAISNAYTAAVKEVEQQARKIYKDTSPIPNGDGFLRIMIEQGCFVLQVALFSLGVSELNNDHWSKDLVEGWVFSLFSIRSQLPLVVLKELMKQSFFKEILNSRKQWKRPKDMARIVMYDQLVEPMLEGSDHKVNFLNQFINGVVRKSMGFSEREPPSTLLHALWLHQTGPGAIIGNVDGGDEGDESSSSWYTVRSATELQKVEITFKNNEGKGSRGIEFKEKMIDAVLCLPSITIEDNTETLFKYLIDYEVEVELGKTQREVCSYLKLMSELVRTPEDAKVLAMQGIVNADPRGEEDLPEMLNKRLQLPDVLGDDQHMVNVRCKIRSYVKPSKWGKVMNLIVITVFLTFLQTLYAILSYHYPKK